MNPFRAATFFICTLVASPIVHAAWVIEPSAEMRASYDDNIRLSTENFEDSGFANVALVQARLSNITERSLVAGVVGISYVDYAKTEGTDDTDNQFLQFILQRDYERGSIGATVSANRDSVFRYRGILDTNFDPQSTTEVDDQLNDLGNNVDDLDRAVTRQQLERTLVNISPNATYNLNQRTEAVLRYQYYEAKFDDETLARLFGAQDTKSHRVTVGLRRRLNEVTSTDINVSAIKFEPDRNPGSDAYEVKFGIQRDISERTRIRVTLGANRVAPDVGDDDDGYSGRLEVTHTTTRGRLRASIGRDLYPSAYGSILESDTLQAGYRHQFSPRFSGSLTVRGISSNSQQTNSSQNRDYAQLSPEISWAMTENWHVTAGYEYTWNDREAESSDAQSNSVFISLQYQPQSEVR